MNGHKFEWLACCRVKTPLCSRTTLYLMLVMLSVEQPGRDQQRDTHLAGLGALLHFLANWSPGPRRGRANTHEQY